MDFYDLLKVDVSCYTANIPPLRRGELASEYNSFIGDYTRSNLSVKDRIIPAYISTRTHGNGCYDRVLEYIRSQSFVDVLDLGCGAGELLHSIGNTTKSESLYGLTICTGEVKYARDNFKLKNIIPGDLRKCDEIFKGFRFDCVLLHCVLQFINEVERVDTAVRISNILKPGSELIVVDYKNRTESQMVDSDVLSGIYDIKIVGDPNLISMGTITSYKLNERVH